MRKIFFCLTLTLAAISCGEKKEAAESNSPDLKGKIEQAEKKLDLNRPDPAAVNELIGLYTRFADSLPKHDKAPVYLMKAADLYHLQGKYVLKCRMYQTVIAKYPGFKDMDMVMYLYALSLDSELNQRDKAKEQYQAYVETFPKSPYVADAQARLTTIDSLSFNQLQERITEKALEQAR